MRLFRTAQVAHGRVDILVNNAAVALAGPAEHETPEDSARVIDTNLTAVLRLCHLVAPGMLARNGGSTVNISSFGALRSFDRFGLSAYAASKAGVLGLTRELAAQWGRGGIRVNAVAPGWFPGGTSGYLQDEYLKTWIGQHTALGRPGRPEELAAVVVFPRLRGKQQPHRTDHRRRRRLDHLLTTSTETPCPVRQVQQLTHVLDTADTPGQVPAPQRRAGRVGGPRRGTR